MKEVLNVLFLYFTMTEASLGIITDLLFQLLSQLSDDLLLLLHGHLQVLTPLKQLHLRVSRLTVRSLQLLLQPLHLETTRKKIHCNTLHINLKIDWVRSDAHRI